MTEHKVDTVANVLEDNLTVTIQRWVARVEELDELTLVPLTYQQRAHHLPRLMEELIARLRLPQDVLPPVSAAAHDHGRERYWQQYTIPMLIEESRLLQITILGTLHRNEARLDPGVLLSEAMIIADECAAQLRRTVLSYAGLESEESEKRQSDSPVYTGIKMTSSESAIRFQ